MRNNKNFDTHIYLIIKYYLIYFIQEKFADADRRAVFSPHRAEMLTEANG